MRGSKRRGYSLTKIPWGGNSNHSSVLPGKIPWTVHGVAQSQTQLSESSSYEGAESLLEEGTQGEQRLVSKKGTGPSGWGQQVRRAYW